MKIIPNYNLNFNQKVSKQQQTNPSFGINKSKAMMFPLGIGAGILGASAQKLIPVQNDTAEISSNSPELVDLPTDMLTYTKLHYMCLHAPCCNIEGFLNNHPNINLIQESVWRGGETYMSTAIEEGRNDVVNLIAGRANYNPTIQENEYGDIYKLFNGGYTDALKTIFKRFPDFDINRQNQYGFTYMDAAINHKDTVDYIASFDKYDPTIPNKEDWTDFHRLYQKGYTDVVQKLHEKFPDFNINQRTKDGHTCMSLAIRHHHKDMVDYIANMDGYDPTIPDRFGTTDFHRLLKNEYIDTYEVLRKKYPNFDIDKKNAYGKSCRMLLEEYYKRLNDSQNS